MKYLETNQIMHKFSLVVLMGLLFYGPINAFSQSDQFTHEKTFGNGLKVIVREDHRSPTVAHMVWYRTGSIDETTGVTGVAHVLEHMMFKGTKDVPAGQFSKRVAALGGRENAFTSNDYTAYFQQIEKSHLPEIMKLEADRMQNLSLSEDEFKKEIQVVMEERRLRTEDQASGLLYEKFMANAFDAAPNRNPVIGWMKDLENMSYLDAQHWYQQWYTPNNAIVVVVGDVEPNDVFALAEKTYGKVPSKALPIRRAQSEPEQKGQKRIYVKAPAENMLVLMGWKAPKIQNGNIQDTDPWALSVLSGILDGNQSTRLNRILVKEKRISSNIGAGYDAEGRSEPLFMVSGTLLSKQKPEVFEQEVKKVIAEIAKNGVKPEELQRVKIAVTASQVYKRDSVFGQAMEIGSTEMAGISWNKIDAINEQIQAITSEQVQLVAKKYFNDDHLTVGILDPQPMDEKTRQANARAATIQR